jgi:hypothetical protein
LERRNVEFVYHLNRNNYTFLTTRLVRAEIYLRSHSNESKSNIMKLNKVLEKLNKKEQRNIVALKRKSLKENVAVFIYVKFKDEMNLENKEILYGVIFNNNSELLERNIISFPHYNFTDSVGLYKYFYILIC